MFFSSEDKMMYIALSKEVFVKSGGESENRESKISGSFEGIQN
jgi:hypothetical protein